MNTYEKKSILAWKLTSDFNTQKHLFSDEIKTDYLIETFICSCSHIESVVKHPEQTIQYRCRECGNEIFYDANRAFKNPENFLVENSNVEFTTEYITKYDNDKISSHYVLKVPNSINFSANKVNYKYQTIYSLALRSDAELEKNINEYEEEDILFSESKEQLYKQTKITENLIDSLTKQINTFCFNVPKPKKGNMTIAQAQFFLIHKNLKDFDFYYWEQVHDLPNEELDINSALAFVSNYKKEKSIKKALNENYIAQLKNSSKFNSYLIQSIINNIKDVNLIVTFLKHNFVYTDELSTLSWKYNMFIEFLKKYYTEKQIVKLFLDYNSDEDELLFRDIINELNINIEAIEQLFNKVPCKISTLHDEFVRCVMEERYICQSIPPQNVKTTFSKI